MRKLNFSAFSLLALRCLLYAGAEEPHWMPDPNLRAVVEKVLREEIGLPEDIPLQKDHMGLLVHILADNRGIRSLQGLEFATNLCDYHIKSHALRQLCALQYRCSLPQSWRLWP